MSGAVETYALLDYGEARVAESSDTHRDRTMSVLFDRHYASMCRLAYVILGDAGLAEEIVMEALLKTFTGWRRLRDPERADAYLRRTVINLSRSRIRRKIIERRVNEIAHAGERQPPDWDADRHETGRLVRMAVWDLPVRQRACVVMRYYEDLPEVEIADVLGCSIGTVKSQLAKARAKLEKALESADPGGDS